MRILARFGPPLLLMGIVFFLSAQPNLSSGLGIIDLIGRKLVHAGTWALLWVLWLRALGGRRPAWAAAIAVAYAMGDEFHQSFVEGRHASPVDVAIDGLGVAIAWAVWRRRSAQVALRG